MKKKICLSILFVFLSGAASALYADFIFTLSQVGPNVVVNGAGTLNLSALTLDSTGPLGSGIQPDIASVTGGSALPATSYLGSISGPASFGGGSSTGASFYGGDEVGVEGANQLLWVPTDYVSGSFLSNNMTFNNATFASLGFTPGTYTYTWGSGATADSLTVTSTPVPEGSTTLLLGIGLAGLFAARWRSSVRRHRSV